MPLFKKKPVVIEAVQWTGHNFEDCAALGEGVHDVSGQGVVALEIATLEGRMLAAVGDWIIKGVKGEVYPCKPDIFEATYDRVWSDGPAPGQTLINMSSGDGLS